MQAASAGAQEAADLATALLLVNAVSDTVPLLVSAISATAPLLVSAASATSPLLISTASAIAAPTNKYSKCDCRREV